MEFLEGKSGQPETLTQVSTAATWSHPDVFYHYLIQENPFLFVTEVEVMFECKYTGMITSTKFIPLQPLNIRGGMDNPSGNYKDTKVPYFDNIRFAFKGIPCVDFNEKVMMPWAITIRATPTQSTGCHQNGRNTGHV